MKAKKHDEIRILAVSKLNTIADHVSTALLDGAISDHEFKLIMSEVEKYSHLKADIRAQALKAHTAVIDEATKNMLIQQGREEANASIRKKLGAD